MKCLYFIFGESELAIDESLTCGGVGGNRNQFTLISKKFKNGKEEINNSNFIIGNNRSINLIYKMSKDDCKLKIFGKYFVKHKNQKCKIIN